MASSFAYKIEGMSVKQKNSVPEKLNGISGFSTTCSSYQLELSLAVHTFRVLRRIVASTLNCLAASNRALYPEDPNSQSELIHV